MDDVNENKKEIRDFCGLIQGMIGKGSFEREQKAKIIIKAGSANAGGRMLSTR